MATFTVLFAIFATACAGVPDVQADINGEYAAVSFVDDPVGFFQLSANILRDSSADPSGGDEGKSSSELGALLKSHNKQPSAELAVLLAAVPRNQFGKIDAAAARYALHRLFASQRGWRIEGLDPDGKAWNSSSLRDVAVLSRLPASDLARLREGWDENGLSAEEVALLAVTIEGLLHEESSERLRLIFELSGLPTDREVPARLAVDAVERCMSSYIMGERVSRSTWSRVKSHHMHMSEIFPAWSETRRWVRTFVSDPEVISFAEASTAIKAISDAHGRFQDKECHDMKKTLMTMEDGATGRVRLADFYGDALNGKWQFQESVDYLRMNGALDEENPGNVRVIIPNYVNGLSNCIGASDYHSICCISECEGIRSHIERSLGKPLATPEEIAATLPSAATLEKGSIMDDVLMLRLRRIAGDNGGMVPVFGRLFAQWLHHAYPRECEFPHLAGKTSPLDIYDMEKVGREIWAPVKDMKSLAAVKRRRDAPLEGAPWVHHEELFGSEESAASRVPPLFVAFHSALFVTTGLGMGWLARSALASLGRRSKPRAGASRRASGAFLPPAML